MPNQIPVTIVTGFLGSGKTTIISHLIKYLELLDKKVVYIKNELGFDDIDTQFIGGISAMVKTQQLTNGFVHHTPLGAMRNALDDALNAFQPDRVIIETAGTEGTADPVSLGLMVDHHPLFFRDGLLSVIDALHFTGYLQLEDYTIDKTKFVDLIVLNKIELVDQQQREAVVGYIREYNELSPIIEAKNGKLNPYVAFGVDMNEDNIPEKIKLYHDHMEAVTYLSDQVFDKAKLEAVFLQFPKTVFRLKGFVRTANGVQMVSGVYKRLDWLATDQNNESLQTKLIIVGHEVQSDKQSLFQMLDSCRV